MSFVSEWTMMVMALSKHDIGTTLPKTKCEFNLDRDAR